ncbi:MAG: hypothetical protein PVF22_00255 [Candidatus Aminicenantes bacterium]|jgi:hypothetical protein
MLRRTLPFLFFSLLFLNSCQTQKIFLSPPSHEIKEFEGYATLRISAERQSARSRFSFLFHLPARGRVDVLDPLGRVPYQLIFFEKRAFFVVPSRKVYWQGGEEEIIEKFLGFRLSLSEVVALMSGQWLGTGLRTLKDWEEGWVVEKDRKGRTQSGKRGDFSFEVQEYFGQSSWVKTVVFRHSQTEGRLKVLDVRFNQPLKKETFSTAFLGIFIQKTWEEIQELLSDAR